MPPSTGADTPPIIAFFTANPATLDKLDLDGEIREIRAELEAEGLGDAFQFLHHPAATPSDLQRVLLKECPVMVQFSGHGQGSKLGGWGQRATRELVSDDEVGDGRAHRERTGIAMQGDGADDKKLVSGEALGGLLSALGGDTRLVFLNACHSAEQAEALLEHVDFVVGIDGAILDAAAKVFAVAFYRALASGRALQTAFDLGVNALMLHGLDTEVRRPVLGVRKGEDPRRFRLVAAPPDADGSLWDVFISYTRKDRGVTRELASALLDQGIRVYFNEWEQEDGDLTVVGLSNAIEKSAHGLMTMSPRSMQDPWVREMYAALLTKAVEDGGRLVPVLVGEGELKLPPFLRTRKPVDLRDQTPDEHEQAIRRLARALRTR